MLIQDMNNEYNSLKEENKRLTQKIAELEETINDIKGNLPISRIKDELGAYKIQILAPNTNNYHDFVTVHKVIWSDIDTTKYLAKEIYTMVEKGLYDKEV